MQNLEHVISHVLLIYTLDVTVEQLHYMLISRSRVVSDKAVCFSAAVYKHSSGGLERGQLGVFL